MQHLKDLEGEEWIDIKYYEGLYQISNKGRVKSLFRKGIRKNGWKNTINEKILKLGNSTSGYRQVALYNVNSISKTFDVHRLVAICFIGQAPSKIHQVNHKDRNRHNNNLSNLEWVTPRENVIHGRDKTNTSSKYIGVDKTKCGWRSTATIKGIRTHLGYFKTEEEARDKYLEANINQ